MGLCFKNDGGYCILDLENKGKYSLTSDQSSYTDHFNAFPEAAVRPNLRLSDSNLKLMNLIILADISHDNSRLKHLKE